MKYLKLFDSLFFKKGLLIYGSVLEDDYDETSITNFLKAHKYENMGELEKNHIKKEVISILKSLKFKIKFLNKRNISSISYNSVDINFEYIPSSDEYNIHISRLRDEYYFFYIIENIEYINKVDKKNSIHIIIDGMDNIKSLKNILEKFLLNRSLRNK